MTPSCVWSLFPCNPLIVPPSAELAPCSAIVMASCCGFAGGMGPCS